MDFTQIELGLFISAFLISVYIAFQEGFKMRNIILITVLLLVLGVNFFEIIPEVKPASITDRYWFDIKNFLMLLEVTMYLLMFVFLLEKRRNRLFSLLYLIFFLFFCLIVGLRLQPFGEFIYPSYSYVFGSLGVLICILLFFYEKLTSAGAENIFRNFWFWISVGLFIFLSTEIPLISLLNAMVDMDDDAFTNQVLPIYDSKKIISLFYYLTYFIGVLCRTRT